MLGRLKALRLAAPLAACLFAWLTAVAAAEAFLQAIPDLPLMEGLSELQNEGLVFDKPDGRIIEAYARGQVQSEAVLRFYEQTLPQLGWQAIEPQAWRREGERLDIAVTQEAPYTLVRFVLKPE